MMHATFKVMVLQRQQELVGPPHYSIIRNTCSHDSLVIFVAFEQHQRRFSCTYLKNNGCGLTVESRASEYGELTI